MAIFGSCFPFFLLPLWLVLENISTHSFDAFYFSIRCQICTPLKIDGIFLRGSQKW